MHALLGEHFALWRKETPYAADSDWVFASFKLKGKRVGFGFLEAGGEPVTFPTSGPCAWFRLWPQEKPKKAFTMLALQEASGQGRSLDLVPFDGFGQGLVMSSEGVGRYEALDNQNANAVSFLFRSGEVWCADTTVTRTGFGNRDFVNLGVIRKGLVRMIEKYPIVLKKLGVPGPYHWQFGLEGVEGFELVYDTVDNGTRYSLPRITTNLIVVEGLCPVPDGATAPLEAITEEIFAECGEPVPGNLR